MIVMLSLHHLTSVSVTLSARHAPSVRVPIVTGSSRCKTGSYLRRPPATAPPEPAMGMDHRWGRRLPTDVAVQVIAKSGARGTGRMANVSLTGAYLETQMTLRPLSLVYLESADRNLANGMCKRIAASVVRHDGRGVGLEWCEPQTKAADVNSL